MASAQPDQRKPFSANEIAPQQPVPSTALINNRVVFMPPFALPG